MKVRRAAVRLDEVDVKCLFFKSQSRRLLRDGSTGGDHHLWQKTAQRAHGKLTQAEITGGISVTVVKMLDTL